MGRPLGIVVLSILCVVGGLVGSVYFLSYKDEPLAAAACAFQIIVGIGLWQHWRWAWWIGLALCLFQLHWNYMHRDQVSQHLWFAAGAATLYFIYVFREYN